MSTTHFGFQQVETSQKASKVGKVFSDVAPYYDVMNDAMSAGLHRLWKDRLISDLCPKQHTHLLDVAGGTGDVAFRFLNAAKNSHVTVCDINADMLAQGRKNAIDRGIIQGIEFACMDAQSLSFEANQFDYYTIAFGIRNVTDIPMALKEAYRILKPGGRFMCLEFSKVKQPQLAKLYDLYSFHVIPKLGKMIASDEASYQYLVESIRMFPDQETFAAMIAEAGFANIKYVNLTGGVVAIHSGYKL
tara:strand:- start:252 stop:989 length:738 start_codon:yes stop_codon:yes gene_type:complete